MGKVSINKLSEYSERMNIANHPEDELTVSMTRAARDWFMSDLIKRKKRLLQAVSDNKTKQSKREKRENELHMLSITLENLNNATKN